MAVVAMARYSVTPYSFITWAYPRKMEDSCRTVETLIRPVANTSCPSRSGTSR